MSDLNDFMREKQYNQALAAVADIEDILSSNRLPARAVDRLCQMRDSLMTLANSLYRLRQELKAQVPVQGATITQAERQGNIDGLLASRD